MARIDERFNGFDQWREDLDHKLFGNGRAGFFERYEEALRDLAEKKSEKGTVDALEERLRSVESESGKTKTLRVWVERGVGAGVAAVVSAGIAFLKGKAHQ